LRLPLRSIGLGLCGLGRLEPGLELLHLLGEERTLLNGLPQLLGLGRRRGSGGFRPPRGERRRRRRGGARSHALQLVLERAQLLLVLESERGRLARALLRELRALL